MARYQLSEPAKADIAATLRTSEELHGKEARIRYRACLTAAMRRVAADPSGLSTVDRPEVAPGIRSFHIRHSRNESRARISGTRRIEWPVSTCVFPHHHETGNEESQRVMQNSL